MGSYFGRTKEEQEQLDAAAEGNEWIAKGAKKTPASDTPEDKDAMCSAQLGVRAYWDEFDEECKPVPS